MNRKLKFTTSYSGGKDAMLALYRGIQEGLEPVNMFTTYNMEAERSWFHGIPSEILKEVSKELNIPLLLVKTRSGDDYEKDFERALNQIKQEGVQACVFGDIDIQEHYDWCDSRCKAVGIQSIFPLWNEKRSDLVYEFIDLGFQAVITTIDSSKISKKFLGKTLTKEIVREIAMEGADICGENGEYHTFVYDGPLFQNPVEITLGDIVENGKYLSAPILLKE